MSGKSVNFGDRKINKSNFYKNKKIFKIEDIDRRNVGRRVFMTKKYLVSKTLYFVAWFCSICINFIWKRRELFVEHKCIFYTHGSANL